MSQVSAKVVPIKGKIAKMPIGGSLAAETGSLNIKYLWPGWIIENRVNVISGPSGVNKSTLGHLIASKLSVGLTPQNEPVTDNRRSLMYVYEDVPEVVKERCTWFGANLGKIRIVDGVDEDRYFDSPEGIESDIAQYRPRLVIFDVFGISFGSLNITEAKHVKSVFKMMTEWCRKYNITILLIHHSKSDPKQREDCLEGSAALKKAVRSAIYVSRWDLEGPTCRAVVPLKMSWSKEPTPLHFWVRPDQGKMALEIGLPMLNYNLEEVLTFQKNYSKKMAKKRLKDLGLSDEDTNKITEDDD